MRFCYFGMSILLITVPFLTHSAAAATITVNATDVIYAAGAQSGEASGAGGTVPGYITLASGATSISFSNVTGSLTTNCSSSEGCISLNGGGNFNDADGNYSAVSTSSETGYGSISGITAPGAGYLVGVFVAAGGPSGTAPTALNYTSTSSTSSSSYSPLLDQVFYIGDGLTGDGSGIEQVFNVPTGAADLYLGTSDASGYNGSPSSYGDNQGTFEVTYAVTTSSPISTPEPASIGLLGAGLAGLLFARSKAKAQ